MPNERIVELTARMLSGETTPVELEELQALLQEHPEEQYFIELLSEYWYHTGRIPDREDLRSDVHFKRILESGERIEVLSGEDVPEAGGEAFGQPERAGARRRIRLVAAMAAAACVLAAVGFFYRSPGTRESGIAAPVDHEREVAVKPGAKSRLLLPDGSTVWLNADSKLTYNSNLNGPVREVRLEGEAYFDIKKDSRPFTVQTGGLAIRVLGTAFNIKSYPRESTFEATLIRGKIEVCRSNDAGPSIVLRPREKLTLHRCLKCPDSMYYRLQVRVDRSIVKPGAAAAITTLSGKIADSAVKETAWVYNKLVFDGETFSEITARLERWFNVKIEITDNEVSALRFHAHFENEPIEEVLRSLQVTAPFDYQINDGTVVISAKGSQTNRRRGR